ncbi:DMT family transporter [Cohnella sp. 56]|uniref:DMT family transporter n=1 Tax=Cohnella sp. 56 TaxID=3113722 RepID=UPI0030EA5E83
MANNNAPAAHASMLAAVFFIGSAVVVGKWSVQAMPVFLSQAAALAAALLILVPLALFKYKKETRVGRRDLLLLLLQALLGMFLYRVFMLYGLKHAAATDSAIVTSLTPAAVALLSWLLLRERLTSRLAAVLYYGWFVTAVAYLLYFRGVTLLPSATVAAYTAVVPVSALLLSSLLLGERLAWPLLVGSVLVVAGMLLIAGCRGRAQPTRSAVEASPSCACPPAKEAAPS